MSIATKRSINSNDITENNNNTPVVFKNDVKMKDNSNNSKNTPIDNNVIPIDIKNNKNPCMYV